MKVVKNYLYNISYQLLNILLPIITVPYVTRIFTSEELGTYGFYNSIVTYFVLIANLGVNIYGTKEIAKSKQINYTFWNIYGVQLLTSISSLILYIISLLVLPIMNNIVAWVLVISLCTRIVDISWLFSGMENFKKITLRNACVKLIGMCCILLFVKDASQLPFYVLCLVIFDFLGQLILWIPARRILSKPAFNKYEIKKNFQPTVMLFLPQVAISLYTVVDRTLLGMLRSFYDVGIYDQGQKLISILITVVTSLGVVMLPRVAHLLSEKKDEEAMNMLKFSFLVYNLLVFPLIIGMLSINDIFVTLFLGKDFQDVKYVIYIMIFKLWSVAWSNILGYQVLVARNKNKEFLISTTVPAIISMLLNLLLIPFLGYLGASLTSIIVEILVLSIQWIYVKEIVPLSMLINKTFFKIIINALVMGGVILGMRIIVHGTSWFFLIMYVTIGAIVYIGLIFITKTASLSEIRKLLQERGI